MEQNRFDLLNFAAKSTLPQNSHLILGASGSVKRTNDTFTDLTTLRKVFTGRKRRHPQGKHPPPQQRDGHLSGRYASHWNAFLLFL